MVTLEARVHTRSAEIFDPASDTFQPTSPLTIPHGDAGAAVLPDGDILVFGDRPERVGDGTYVTPSGPILKTRSAEVFR
jgi:hypothetical protein